MQGMSVDYMHCVLLGVTRQFLHLWFDSKHHSEPWYLGSKVKEIDELLMSIQPTSEIVRLPRELQKSLRFWKGIIILKYSINDMMQAIVIIDSEMYILGNFVILLNNIQTIAQELKNWLLHYSLPIVLGILPKEYVNHHQSLVEGMHILLGNSVVEKKLKLPKKHLCHYVFSFGCLYGE